MGYAGRKQLGLYLVWRALEIVAHEQTDWCAQRDVLGVQTRQYLDGIGLIPWSVEW